MDINKAHSKLIQLAPNATLADFMNVLQNLATPSNPVRTTWMTDGGRQTTHKLYWISGPLGDGISGGTDTKANKTPPQFNIPVVDTDGRWRTLSTGNRIVSFTFNNIRFRLT